MSLSLSKVTLLLDQAETLIEERQRLNELNLKPSKIENNDLINVLNKIIKNFNYFHEDLINLINRKKLAVNVRTKYDNDFDKQVDNYEQLLHKLDDDLLINNDDFKYTREPLPEMSNTKTVRFRDNLVDEEPEPTETTPFKPYSDNPDESETARLAKQQLFSDRTISPKLSHSSLNEFSTQQIFVQHQQQIVKQDDQLSLLSNSIQRQRDLGLIITDELDDQMIILNDVENLVDRSENRLENAKRRLNHFSRMARENGQWLTIIILTVVLIILLVVLK